MNATMKIAVSALSIAACGALIAAWGWNRARSQGHAGHADQGPGVHQAAHAAVKSSSHSDNGYWTCSMHPAVRSAVPGKCPICGMTLIPITQDQIASGEITIDAQHRQEIGVRTAVIQSQELTIAIQAPGRITFDETAFTDVSLKIGGWVTALDANSTGMMVHQGQPLMTLYSPDLYAAEQEYVLLLHGLAASAPVQDRATLDAARERLQLWGLSDAQIQHITESGAQRTLVIPAPATGILQSKEVLQGSAVLPGQRLFRLASIDQVWVIAQVFESDLALVHQGLPVQVAISYLPGSAYAGTIDYVYPILDPDTRSARVRIRLGNADHRLMPEMYAGAVISVDVGRRLLLPKSAVIYTGPRRLVFVDHGEGRLRPVQVQLGLANDQYFEVLDGLSPGDQVVTSGNFLIAAESRIRSAEQFWGGDHDNR